MIALAAAVVIAAAIAWSAWTIAHAIRHADADRRRVRALGILTAFAPGLQAAQSDPRALLVWQPLARTARTLYPDEFALLDRAAGVAFPFSPERLQAAHADWTTDWLAWERAHDVEYKRAAAAAVNDRSRLDIIERERLDTYQRRYEQYIRVAKALQALAQP